MNIPRKSMCYFMRIKCTTSKNIRQKGRSKVRRTVYSMNTILDDNQSTFFHILCKLKECHDNTGIIAFINTILFRIS